LNYGETDETCELFRVNISPVDLDLVAVGAESMGVGPAKLQAQTTFLRLDDFDYRPAIELYGSIEKGIIILEIEESRPSLSAYFASSP
jgi:hypothetical protein